MSLGMPVVDLNADLGESFGSFKVGQDEEVIPLVTSANVACGFHGGDPRVMDRTVRACREAGVAVGAHPSFPDLVGFGRRAMDVTPFEAETDIVYQVAALAGFCRRNRIDLQHVKPHGAINNLAAHDTALAEAIAVGVASYDPGLILICQPETELARAAEQVGLRVAREGYVDRAYGPDGRLVSRRQEGAVYRDPERAVQQALRMVTESTVVAIDGTVIQLQVDTLCVHGDNPEAVNLLRLLRQELAAAGVQLQPLAEVLR
jgi:UPF0271 protein